MINIIYALSKLYYISIFIYAKFVTKIHEFDFIIYMIIIYYSSITYYSMKIFQHYLQIINYMPIYILVC